MVTDTKQTPLGFLEEFFDEFETFVRELGVQCEKKADDEDERALVKTFATPIPQQIKEIKSYVIERASKAPKNSITEASRALSMSNGTQFAKSAKGIFGSIGSFLGNLGISNIVKELKKIVRLIFDAFGWTIPKWLETLFLLIDELIDKFLGGGSTRLSAALSKQETQYLAELTALRKLQNAQAHDEEDEEDDF